jgi:hypothetical protein
MNCVLSSNVMFPFFIHSWHSFARTFRIKYANIELSPGKSEFVCTELQQKESLFSGARWMIAPRNSFVLMQSCFLIISPLFEHIPLKTKRSSEQKPNSSLAPTQTSFVLNEMRRDHTRSSWHRTGQIVHHLWFLNPQKKAAPIGCTIKQDLLTNCPRSISLICHSTTISLVSITFKPSSISNPESWDRTRHYFGINSQIFRPKKTLPSEIECFQSKFIKTHGTRLVSLGKL